MKAAERQTSPTGIGLPRDLKEYLTQQAKREDRSLSREIVRRLAESRRRDEQREAHAKQSA